MPDTVMENFGGNAHKASIKAVALHAVNPPGGSKRRGTMPLLTPFALLSNVP